MAITKISPSVVDFDAGITISTTDNSTNLTLSSTDADANGGPILDFYRNSSSPADNDVLFQSNIYAENDADEKIAYGYINTFATDVSDGSESMKLNLNMYSAGTALNRLELSSSETVFNQDSGDIDFRVESDGNANTFIVDGGTDEVRIPHNIAAQTIASLNVRENGAALEFGHQNNTGQYYGTLGAFGSNGDPYIGFATDSESSANTFTTRGSKGCLITHGSGDMRFMAVTSASATGQTPVERVRIRNAGGITFNGDTATANALQDYEEGSFTIGVTGATASLGNATAYYTKIGDLVYFFWYSASSTFSSASGTATLTGLPFTQDGQSSNYGLFQFVHGNGVDGNSTGGYITNNATSANFIDAGGVGGASFNNGSSQYIMVQGMYKTDA